MRKALRIHDPILFGLTLLVSLLGIVFIFDAGYARSIAAGHGPLPREFKQQVLLLIPAIIASGIVAAIGGEKWRRWAKVLWVIAFISLILPFVPGIGETKNGATRWVKFGPVELQPAEFAKLAVILYMAAVFANRPAWPKKIKAAKSVVDWIDRIATPKVLRMMPMFWVLCAVVLIEKEPDLGTAASVAVIAFAMCIVGGASKKTLLIGLVFAIAGVTIMTVTEPYRMARITTHSSRWDPQHMDDLGYQTVQSELAIASGGILGAGPGAGRAKHVMPAATNDFMLATIAEEFGFVGVVLMLGALGMLVWRLFWLAQGAPTPFAALILTGVGVWIALQTVVNIMMANGTLPPIGIPLPFISSGGSSLIALWMGIGLCQSALAPEAAKEEKKGATSSNRRRHRGTRVSRPRSRPARQGARA